VTNEELDRARVDEAIRAGNGIVGSIALIAARLAREGWTPPVAVDPDEEAALTLWDEYNKEEIEGLEELVLEAIKRGRALANAEAQPENNYKIKIKWEDTPEEAAARKRGMLERFVTIKPEDAA
jgi:hypothetical protein